MRSIHTLCWMLIFLTANLTAECWSQESKKSTVFWPEGIQCDDSIPTPESYFGFDIGFRHLSHAQVAGYVKALASASDRISIQQYAETHGGRPLLLLTITSPENRNRLNEIRKSHRMLAKPNADRIELENLPAVINMGYGVHGDESSATNCAPLVAYYLAAAKGKEIEQWLNDCVILLDPSLNPDGFNRFANWANRYRGRTLNPDPQHAEHNQMWPPGRVNYYWFDLNRDWLPLVHPESRGRMKWYHQWKPNVVLDFHEMGTQSTYFFQPGIPERTNPLTPARNQELTRKFATFHAKELDKRGSLYFTQERFDDFYMGKGSTYPDLHGCVGILFEQASSRGHVQKNQDGLLRFHDTIANQFTSSLTSLRATSKMRKQLLNYKVSFYKQALKMADKDETKTYLFTGLHNRERLNQFGQVLSRHDIRSFTLKEDLEYGDRTFDAEYTLVVPAKQSEFRFLKSLLMRQKRFQENIFYDVSSWTLPLAYGLEQAGLKRELDSEGLLPFKVKPVKNEALFKIKDGEIGYLIDYRDDVAPWILARLQTAGVKVRLAKRPVKVLDGDDKPVEFGHGTLSVMLGVQKNKRDAIERVLNLGVNRGATVVPVFSGLSQSGPDLGSPNFPVLKKPKIAMLTGSGASAYTAGEVWHLIDTQIGLPVTHLKSSSFTRARLDDYSVLVIAGGQLDSSVWKKVSGFAEAGGTVIGVGSVAVSMQRSLSGDNESSNLATTSRGDGSIQQPFDSASNQRALKLISGAIFKTKVDLTHPLLYGFTRDELPVFRNHSRFLKPSKNVYCNPIIYDDKDPLMAGYCSDENQEKFKGSPSVVVAEKGRGRFILMADNPNFRGFWKATSRVFLNAVFFGDLVDP